MCKPMAEPMAEHYKKSLVIIVSVCYNHIGRVTPSYVPVVLPAIAEYELRGQDIAGAVFFLLKFWLPSYFFHYFIRKFCVPAHIIQRVLSHNPITK